MPVWIIALTMAMNSRGSPMQILKPTGLPPESSRSCAMNAVISSGVEKALWYVGENTSLPCGHQPRLGDLRGHLGRREDAAVAGLGALGDLDLDHLDLGQRRVVRNASGSKSPLASRQPK